MKKYFTEKWIVNYLSLVSALAFFYALYVFASSSFEPDADDNISWLVGSEKLNVAKGEVRDIWYKTEMNGKPLGYSHYQEIHSGENLIIFDVSKMVISAMGTKKEITTSTRVILNKQGNPERFTFNVDSPPTKFSLKGKIKDNIVDLIIKSGDREDVNKITLKDKPKLEIDLMHRVAKQGFAKGKIFKTMVFNPQTFGEQEVTIEIIGKEKIRYMQAPMEVWHVVQKVAGVSMEQWVDDNGEAYIATAPLGMKIIRTTRRSALYAFKQAGGEDIILQSSVKVAEKMPHPTMLSALTLKLSGTDFKGFELNSFRQKFKNDTIVITREDTSKIKTLPLPVNDKKYTEYLKSEPLVQSDAPEIISQARKVIGDEKDALKAGAKLSVWVYNNIRKENVIGVPSAIEVLKNRVGDCNEHSALFVAFCRAVGLPARIASGLVSLGDDFFYHAWAEIFVGEWITVDPTFNQIPADVSHIRFTTGGLEKQIVIMKLIGNLKIKISDHVKYERFKSEQ